MAKRPKRRASKITDQQRDDMFTYWQEKQSLRYVAQKVALSMPTVVRYRERDNWDERLTKIKAKAQKKADNTAADMRARHILGAKFLQAKSIEFIKETGMDTVGNAINAYQVGVRIEKEACGEPGAIVKTVGDLESLSLEELEERLRKLRQGESV